MAAATYIRPATLKAALEHLRRHGPGTKILAGGTDLVVDMRRGAVRPDFILDVSRLAELKGIALGEEGLSVGAAVTLAEIERSSLLARHAPALRAASLTFASPQIRNVATIGGNVAHCSPCGDTVPPLLIHEAAAVIAGPAGARVQPVEEIAAGPYACALPPDELIVRFVLKPAPAGLTFADFQKIGRRRQLAIARLNAAAMALQEPGGRLGFFRFALGACTPTPRRLAEVEGLLAGRVPTAELLWEAGRLLAARTLEITGRRASAAYKEPAIQGLFVRMLQPLVAA
jgi:CO/xanthine dehydrogenase FAD-binding subunit